jgi:hypothetical protein
MSTKFVVAAVAVAGCSRRISSSSGSSNGQIDSGGGNSSSNLVAEPRSSEKEWLLIDGVPRVSGLDMVQRS